MFKCIRTLNIGQCCVQHKFSLHRETRHQTRKATLKKTYGYSLFLAHFLFSVDCLCLRSSSRGEYLTPPDLFENEVKPHFDSSPIYDAACSGLTCVSGCKRLTSGPSSTTQDTLWDNRNIYINPPFHKIHLFTKKILETVGATMILMIPVPNSPPCYRWEKTWEVILAEKVVKKIFDGKIMCGYVCSCQELMLKRGSKPVHVHVYHITDNEIAF